MSGATEGMIADPLPLVLAACSLCHARTTGAGSGTDQPVPDRAHDAYCFHCGAPLKPTAARAKL
jgi:hypothetical protein